MIYEEWNFTAIEDCKELIIPDGCCDIIIVESPDRQPSIKVTNIDLIPKMVNISKCNKMTGYRLIPGMKLNRDEVAEIFQDNQAIHSDISFIASTQSELIEIIAALSKGDFCISKVAHRAGLSERSLQRLFKRKSLPSPSFWYQLARARRAACAISSFESLADIAYTFGFSDQAHMTREIVRWFRQTPGQIRRNTHIQSTLGHSGLGNWT